MKGLTIKFTLILSTITVLTFLSLICYATIEEGTQVNGILSFFAIIFSKLFYVLRFPTHTIFIEHFSNADLFIMGLAINSVLWTIIFFLTTHYFKKWGINR